MDYRTDRDPNFTHQSSEFAVTFVGLQIGSTDIIHHNVWGIAFIVLFAILGGGIGYLIGKGLDRLSNLGIYMTMVSEA